jgi:hypothetical protein
MIRSIRFADSVYRRINEFFSAKNSAFVGGVKLLTMAVRDCCRHELLISRPRNILLRSEMPQHRISIYYSRRLHPKINAMATVCVILGLLYHPGPHRIEMDIAD